VICSAHASVFVKQELSRRSFENPGISYVIANHIVHITMSACLFLGREAGCSSLIKHVGLKKRHDMAFAALLEYRAVAEITQLTAR
jgi:hypothetical protein